MATKTDLQGWVENAIKDNGGRAKLIDVARHIWQHHESDLKASGDLFYTWQYDMRWAANQLRTQGILSSAETSPRGVWILKG
ncbi:MAG: hypothetical protein PVG66_03555 [Chromatiales bacterium]|jgi:hypothetical protein